MPNTQRRPLTKRGQQPEGLRLPAIQPASSPVAQRIDLTPRNSPGQDLLQSLSTFLQGRQAAGEKEQQSGILARFKQEFTGEDVARDDKTRDFLIGVDKLDGKLAGEALARKYAQIFSTSKNLKWQDTYDDTVEAITEKGFSTLLHEAELEATKNLDTKAKLQGFMGPALKGRNAIEAQYNEHHTKIFEQELKDRQAKLLDAQARGRVEEVVSKYIGKNVSVDDIKDDPYVYDAILAHTDEIGPALAKVMRSDLSEQLDNASVLGFSKPEVSKIAADVYGKLGVDLSMEEVLAYRDEPDNSGIRQAITPAGDIAIAKAKEAHNLRTQKLVEVAKKKKADLKEFGETVLNKIRAVVIGLDPQDITNSASLLENLQTGGVMYEPEGRVIPFTELFAGNGGAYGALMKQLKNNVSLQGYPKESNQAVQRRLEVEARRGRLSWESLSLYDKQLNREDYNTISGLIASSQGKKSPDQIAAEKTLKSAESRMTRALAETDKNGVLSGMVPPVISRYINDAIWEFDKWFREKSATGQVPTDQDIEDTQKGIIDFYTKVLAKVGSKKVYFDTTPYFEPRFDGVTKRTEPLLNLTSTQRPDVIVGQVAVGGARDKIKRAAPLINLNGIPNLNTSKE